MSLGSAQIYRSVTSGAVPTALLYGELAINIPDNKLWVGDEAGLPVEISLGGSMIVQELKPDESLYTDGQEWLRTSDMKKFTLYVDADSSQWVSTE